MLTPAKIIVATILLSMLVLAPIATVGLVLSTDAANAKNGKGKGKATGKNPKKEREFSQGAIASGLKKFIAAHSLKNGQGYLIASADSNIGQIATVGLAELAFGEAQKDFDDLFGEVDAALKYIENCANPPADFVCEADIETAGLATIAANTDKIESYSVASLMLETKSLDFDRAENAGGIDHPSPLALYYFNALLKFGKFELAELAEAVTSGEDLDIAEVDIDIAEASLDF